MIELFNNILKKEYILANENMKKHTTFKIGGDANIMLLPSNENEILQCIEICQKNNINYYIIGNGSNILVSDNGYNGVIVKISSTFNDICINGNVIKAKAGATLAKVAKVAMENSLVGCEFLCSIPGTIGGGICMNAGAYGGELMDIVETVTVLKDGHMCTLSNSECEFEYRNSKILRDRFIVLEVTISLHKGEKEQISNKMKENIKKRNNSQPIELPNAGSTFKRPKDNFAGKLIMEAGLAGRSVGGAMVSKKHCGFIVNDNNATCSDVISLMDIVRGEVKNQFDVELENEIRIVGEV